MSEQERADAQTASAGTAPAIVFLLYYSRSGSTFLSSRLDAYGDIGVTVESHFTRALILDREELSAAHAPREVHKLLAREERFMNLGVSAEDLEAHLRGGGGYGAGEVARAVLAAYFAPRKPGAKVWVVKDGTNGYWIRQLAREIPEARFIHVIRDGRAVMNSGLNNERPYARGERMTRDPLTLARLWSRFVDGIADFAAESPGRVIEVRYEDLISGEESELARVRRSLGLPEARRSGDGSGYYANIPEKERTLHGLVSGEAVSGRIEAWRKELRPGDLLVFERRAAGSLRRHGYGAPQRSLPELLRRPEFAAAYVRSIALRVRDWGRLALDPARLRRILDNKLLFRRERSAR